MENEFLSPANNLYMYGALLGLVERIVKKKII